MESLSEKVRHRPQSKRFELVLDGHLNKVDYQLRKGHLILVHTEVALELEGKGVGSSMAEYAFDYARREGLKIIPLCPFIKAYLREHPEHHDVVHPNYVKRLKL